MNVRFYVSFSSSPSSKPVPGKRTDWKTKVDAKSKKLFNDVSFSSMKTIIFYYSSSRDFLVQENHCQKTWYCTQSPCNIQTQTRKSVYPGRQWYSLPLFSSITF